MALRIFEMTGTALIGSAPVRRVPFNDTQSGVVGASSTQSAAFEPGTTMVTLQADEACHVVFGPNPTATTGGFKLAAGETADFGVQAGDKVAWIQA